MILQWNINGFYKHLPELNLILSELHPFVLCLQETHFKSKPHQLKKFKCYSTNRRQQSIASGGVATYVSDEIDSEQISLNSQLEVVAVKVHAKQEYTVLNIYLPNSQILLLEDLKDLIQQITPPYIITGDFNAHHILWESDKIDKRGRIIERLIDEENLVLLNSGDKTRFNAFNGGFSAIDLTMCDPSLAAFLTWETTDHLYSSDHIPIKIKFIDDTGNNNSHYINKKWNLRRADWQRFSRQIEVMLNDEKSFSDIDSMVEYFTGVIISVAEETIGRIKPHRNKRTVPWWNNRCDTILRQSKSAYNRYKRHKTEENLAEFKRLRSEVRHVFRTSKKESWKNYTMSINASTPPAELWDKVRRINGVYGQHKIHYLETDQRRVTGDSEIAETLSNHFEKVAGDRNYSAEFKIFKDQTESQEIVFDMNQRHPINSPITRAELEEALKDSRNSAPGPDDVPVIFLQHLPEKAKAYLLKIFNDVWQRQYVPENWRQSTVIPIPKPNKPKMQPSSYRPISLTNTSCKLMEKIVNKRLIHTIEERNLLYKHQNGFRKNRSALDSIVALETEIHEAFASKQELLAIFFDLEKAYDTTWRRPILNKLKQWNIEGNMLAFVQNFLQNRTFRVRYGESLSNRKKQRNGIPQGSVMSVSLFLIAINDAFADVNSPVGTNIFADDLLLFVRGKDKNHMQKMLQDSLHKLEKWTKTSGFNFSVDKTKCILFSKKPRHRPVLNLQEQALEYTDEVKYLGVTFDERLTWKSHIVNLRKTCTKLLGLIKALAHYQWGADSSSLLKIYRSIIRSRIDYALIAYSTASRSLLKYISTIENAALRISLGAYRTSPADSLHHLASELPLLERAKLYSLRYAAKISENPTHPNYQLTISDRFKTLFQRQNLVPPLYARVTRTLAEFRFKIPDVLSCQNIPAPWISPPFLSDIRLSLLKKSSTHPYLIQSEFKLLLEGYQNRHFIYTDASKTPEGTGAAVITPDEKLSFRLPKSSSIQTGELLAILKALEYARSHPENSYAIATDSLWSIQTLKLLYPRNPLAQRIKIILGKMEKQPVLIYVPSHVGITGNEMADEEAREAANREMNIPQEDIFTSHDVQDSLKHAALQNWDAKWEGSRNKLKEVKPSIKTILPILPKRPHQIALNRLCIGHTKITHGYLIKREDPPVCEVCNTELTVQHILLECNKFPSRRQLISVGSLKELLGSTAEGQQSAIDFLKITKLLEKI